MPKRGARPSHSRRDGVEGKVCGICREWKPLTEFRPRTSGGYHYDCIPCRRLRDAQRTHPHQRTHGLVAFVPLVRNALEEMVNRVGKAETARLCGIPKQQVSRYTNGRAPERVQRETARMILEALRDLRASGVVLSRDSIRHGSFERGENPREAHGWDDYYKIGGDAAAEYRRNYRARVHRESE
jgi:hypothetical protein